MLLGKKCNIMHVNNVTVVLCQGFNAETGTDTMWTLVCMCYVWEEKDTIFPAVACRKYEENRQQNAEKHAAV